MAEPHVLAETDKIIQTQTDIISDSVPVSRIRHALR